MRAVSLCIFAFLAPLVCSGGLKEIFSWSRISFIRETDHKDGESPQVASYSESISDDLIPTGINTWGNKLFISIPRRNRQAPVTLGYIPLDSKDNRDILLRPYPSWSKNSLVDSEKSDNLVSVQRLSIDSCDRLWFIDTGLIKYLDGSGTKVRDQRLVIIDLKTDKIINSYTIPQGQLTPASVLTNLVVDVGDNECGDAFAYIADERGYGLIVYSLRDNDSWRLGHNYFYLEPRGGIFNFTDKLVQRNEGVYNLELSQSLSDGYRILYFQPLAGLNLYEVSTKVLRKREAASLELWQEYQYIGRRPDNWQAISADLYAPLHESTNGIFFFGLANLNAIGCRSQKQPYLTDLITSNQTLPYPDDVKIRGERIYVLTNNLPRYLYGKLNRSEVNFQIWSSTISDAVKGTNCSLLEG